MSNERFVVFSDDWGRHPSSCQHLFRHLLKDHDVTWVNTIGMRPPRFDLLTLNRGIGKVRGWLRHSGPEESRIESTASVAETGPRVIDAKMWPWMSHSWDRRINRGLLTKQLCEVISNATVVTTIPIVADLVGRVPAKRWVYYCVDDFSVWPGLDGESLGEMEGELLPKMNRIVAASENLAEGIRQRGKSAEVLTHGVDLDFWTIDTGGLVENRAPVALFWGVVDRRLNADWVLALADEMVGGEVRLVGPQQDPDPRLCKHPRICMTGSADFQSLPKLAAQADVLVMPYADLPVTRAMQPLKLKEYLATGLPVVVAPLPAVEPWAEFLDIARDRSDFVHMVGNRVKNLTPSERTLWGERCTRLRERLTSESWDAKAKEFIQMITQGD